MSVRERERGKDKRRYCIRTTGKKQNAYGGGSFVAACCLDLLQLFRVNCNCLLPSPPIRVRPFGKPFAAEPIRGFQLSSCQE